MVVGFNMGSAGAILNQPTDLESWRQSPQSISPDSNQQNCILGFSNNSRRSESPIQNLEDNCSYGSENGPEENGVSSPQREAAGRSSGSEETTSIPHMFPISSSSMMQQCMEFSNSENESSQASPLSFNEDDGYRSMASTKSSNSSNNGKPKVHKCRSCGFTTTDKHESWLHIAIHMKPEKILRCPECPFVTEYKHHLDFHVWNHQGMKPYKCDKCPYVCVNKSMLKSHLKSHSNVYQYRCANCAYRTKYCHSLKIHLRKYRHEPGLVLDSEGNPNPNPVIDVYGNRRGPKQKPKKEHTQPMPNPITTINSFQNFPWMNSLFFGNATDTKVPPLLPPVLGTPFIPEPKKLEELNRLNGSDTCVPGPAVPLTENNNDDTQLNLQSFSYKVPQVAKEEFLDWKPSVIPLPANKLATFSYDSIQNENDSFGHQKPDSLVEKADRNTEINRVSSTNESTDCVPLNLSLSQTSDRSSKNRRKGVAFKLKRTSQSIEEEDEDPVTKVSRMETSRDAGTECKKEDKQDPDGNEDLLAKLKNKKSIFYCGFCEITFFNQIMFTMHMGYHGYLDPFTCNRCGEKTEDSIAFYAHMVSSAHM